MIINYNLPRNSWVLSSDDSAMLFQFNERTGNELLRTRIVVKGRDNQLCAPIRHFGYEGERSIAEGRRSIYSEFLYIPNKYSYLDESVE